MTTSNSKTTRLTRGLILTSVLTSFACTDLGTPASQKYEPCSSDAIAKSCDQVDRFYTGTYPEIDNIMDSFMTDNGLQGCGVGLMRGEEIVYLKSYGNARVGGLNDTVTNVPWDLDTFFPIASSTKTITAVMLLQMLEDESFPSVGTDLNAPVSALLPDITAESHPKLAALTLNQLLSHTSGIPQSNGGPGSGAVSDDIYWATELDTVDEIDDAYSAVYKPYLHPSINIYGYKDLLESNILTDVTPVGRYNNSNYRIAASVIDYHDTYKRNPNNCFLDESCHFGPNYKRGKTGYEAYFRDFIATAPDAPEDMMTTMCLQDFDRYEALPTLALGYDWNLINGIPVLIERERSEDIGRQTGSTGMMSTIGDFARFILAMNNGDLISDSSLVEMSTPRSSLLFGPYGLGAWPISRTLPISGAATGPQGAGNKEGFSSWWSVLRPNNGEPALGMVLSCNTNVYNERIQLADDLLNKLDVLLSQNNEPHYKPYLATCDGAQMSQGASLMATWRDVLLQEQAHYLERAQGDFARAIQLVRADLRAERGGVDVLNAFDRGDLELAAGPHEGVLEERRARRAASRSMSTTRR